MPSTSSGGRRGRHSLPVDPEFKRLVRAYVEKVGKNAAAAAELGVSESTLKRILNGASKYLEAKIHTRIRVRAGLEAGSSNLVMHEAQSPRSQVDIKHVVASATLLDARGDHSRSSLVLSEIDESVLPIRDRVALRLAKSRNAMLRGDAELAESLLQHVVVWIRRERIHQLLLARVVAELASIQACRNKTFDAIDSYLLAETVLLPLGEDAAPFLMLVRQSFLAFALRIGNSSQSARLLKSSIEASRRLGLQGELAAELDGWLLDRLSQPHESEGPQFGNSEPA